MLEIKLFLAYSEKEDLFMYLFVISRYIFCYHVFYNVKKFFQEVSINRNNSASK